MHSNQIKNVKMTNSFFRSNILWNEVNELQDQLLKAGFPEKIIDESLFTYSYVSGKPGKDTWFTDGLLNLLMEYFGEERPPSIEEALDMLIFIVCQTDHYKVSVLATILIRNNNGELTPKALEKILREGIKDNGIIFDDEEISHMTNVMMNESGYEKEKLTLKCLMKIFDAYSELYESLSSRWGIQ